MLPAAGSTGNKLKAWNTNPTRSRRSRVNCRSGIAVTSSPPIHTRPESGESSPAMQCSSVDFPDPDGPITAVNDPAGISTLTPASAVTTAGPEP